MTTLVIALVIIALAALIIGVTVRSRRQIERMHLPASDLRRAGDDHQPPFEGQGTAV